jgi:fucose permease
LKERLYIVACGAMLAYGVILGLPGTVLGLPETVAELGLTLSGRGSLIAALFVGLLAGSLLSGPVVDRLGYRTTLAVMSALVAVTMPLFALARTAALAGISLIALGISAAGVNTASNALSSELFPGERAQRLNRLAVMAGAGGLLMPIATVLASAVVSWRMVVVGAAVLFAIVAIASAMVPSPKSPAPGGHSTIEAVRSFARERSFAGFAVVLLLGGGNEASMAGWTSSYLQASGFTASTATWVLASHWLGLILARVLLPHRVEEAKAAAVTRSALIASMCVAALVIARVDAVLMVAPFAIGVAMALVIPTTLALAGDRYRVNSGALFGLLLTLLQIGGIALPAAIGFVSDLAGLRAGMSIIAASSVCIAAVTYWRIAERGRAGS